MLIPEQQDNVTLLGPTYAGVVCPGATASRVPDLLKLRPPEALHSHLQVPADGPLVAGGPPDWKRAVNPSSLWLSSTHDCYLARAVHLPVCEQELRTVALFVAFASTLPAPTALADDRAQLSEAERLTFPFDGVAPFDLPSAATRA